MTEQGPKQGRYECPACGSERGLAYYGEASHCFSCNTHTFYNDTHRPPKGAIIHEKIKKAMTALDPAKLQVKAITDRNITEATVKKYGVRIKVDEKLQPESHLYPVYNRDAQPAAIGVIYRHLPKRYETQVPSGLTNASLFGSHIFPSGCAKAITVTEGHLDAMAAYEMTGSRWPVVSVNGGASTADKEFRRNLEYLESFSKVYICFDRDKPGQEATTACAKLLSPGKAHIVNLSPELKDACGYRVANKAEDFQRAWWDAAVYTPAGILSSSAVKERIRNREVKPGVPWPFEGLNDKTYGIRTGEAVIVTAPTGVGKTQFLRETQHAILSSEPEAKIGTIYLEEIPEDSGLGLMSTAASIPFHLPDASFTPEQYAEAEKILDEDRVYFYDSFGSNSIDDIIGRVRYYARGLGCKYIILDHLSIIVSDQQQGDERKKLDEIMTKLKTLTIELDIALIAVIHTNRQGQIRGTAGVEQLANIVIKLERDLEATNPDIRRTIAGIVSKNRFSGKTGPAFQARYDEDTGRTEELAASDEFEFNDLIKEAELDQDAEALFNS